MGNSQKKQLIDGTRICGSLFCTNSVGYIIPYSIDNILFQEKQMKISKGTYQEIVEFSQITQIEIVRLSLGGEIVKIHYKAPKYTALFEFVSPNEETLNKIKLMKFELQV